MTDGNPSRLKVVGGTDTEVASTPEPLAKIKKAKRPRKVP
jgi:hypothetical protein